MRNVEKPNEGGNNNKSLKSIYRNYCTAVNDFALGIIYFNSEEEIAWHIAHVSKSMGLYDCVVYLWDEETGCFETKAAFGEKNPWGNVINNPLSIRKGEGIVGTVGQNGIPEIIKDTRKDPRYKIDIEANLSEMAIPILYEDKVLGVIDSEHHTTAYYSEEHLTSMTTVAALAATRIMNIRNQNVLRQHKESLQEEVDKKTKELKVTIDSLNRSNTDLEHFAFAISHDLREPLRTISGLLSAIMSKNEQLTGNTQTYMDMVIDGATRMNDMMEGLLEYSRLNYSNELHRDVEMDDVILMVEASLRASVIEKKAQIISHNLPAIHGNGTQIVQLFQNLISNAIKFSRKDVPPVVEISAVVEEEEYIFTVSDNGMGIPELMQKHIFKLFYKGTKSSGAGSGIGLALCKRIVDCHKGNIYVNSEPDKGTSFQIHFPKKNKKRLLQ